MKKRALSTGLLCLVLIAGLGLAACKERPEEVGVVEIVNHAPTYRITKIALNYYGSRSDIRNDNVNLGPGEKKVYYDIPAKKLYKVWIMIDINVPFESQLFRVDADKTVTVAYEITHFSIE